LILVHDALDISERQIAAHVASAAHSENVRCYR